MSMWAYAQSSGEVLRDGRVIGVGYSGLGEGKNNPALQRIANVGPIPRGKWIIGMAECVHEPGPHGPFVLPLTPCAGTETYGRSGFLVHGDALDHMGSASHGCVILGRALREQIAASRDTDLEVIA